jgi:hypothetical protein
LDAFFADPSTAFDSFRPYVGAPAAAALAASIYKHLTGRIPPFEDL